MAKVTPSPPTSPAPKPSEDAGEARAARHRSPNYPVIGLRKAVDRATKLYEQYKRSWAPAAVAQVHLGYKAGSGVAKQVTGALKAFGLIELQGEAAKSEMRVSERSFRIIHNHADRAGLLRAAALGPTIHAEIWKKYGDEGIPPDDALKHHLLFDRNFNPEVVDGFIGQFKDTISFAKLEASDKIAEDQTPPGEEDVDEMLNNTEIPNSDKSGQNSGGGKLPIAGMTQDTFMFEGKQALIRWPAVLTPEQYQDLQDWIKLALRKTARESGLKPEAKA